jgi:6-phosphogluconolactonase
MVGNGGWVVDAMTRTDPEVLQSKDANRLAQAAADLFVDIGSRAIAARGRFSVVLSGGSTPKHLYNLLASQAYRHTVDWDNVYIFWGDERCVPPDHPDSNFRMARQALLDHVPIPEVNIFRIHVELDPLHAASEYERRLHRFFAQGDTEKEGSLSFDLVYLGMGDDGHTASLFPGVDALHELESWVAAYFVEKLGAWRITLTPVVINAAENVVFLVSGSKKAERLQQVLYGSYQPGTLPAQIVQPSGGNLIWLVDEAAAALL